MEISSINIRLLFMFYEVYRSGSVSQAARTLGISQPNVTIGLNRLRDHFGDPLFVRVGGKMQPTAQAEQFAQGMETALASLSNALHTRTHFDPATSSRTFRLAMTEIMQITVLPQLFERISPLAPSVRLDVCRVSEETLRDLEAGKVDVAMGFFAESGPNFHEHTLVVRDFVCIARSGHPRIGQTITEEQFYAERHVSHLRTGTAITRPEQALDRKRARDIALTLPDLAGIDAVVARSDLIATVPRVVAKFFQTRSPIRILDHPVSLQKYAVKYHWHERFHRDPAIAWLREQIKAVFDTRTGGLR